MKKSNTENRKLDHIEICINENVCANVTAGFEEVSLIHNAIPELDLDEIDTKTYFFGKKIDYPIMFAAITGGHETTKIINENIAIVAEKLNIPVGIGSQRAALEDERLKNTYKTVRDIAPSVFLVGNVGISQIINDGTNIVKKSIEMIDADAIAIHCNVLQELIQPEGDRKFRGALSALSKIVESVNVPVIVKEIGSGISSDVAKKLKDIGISGIDVGGLGGTSWAAVEYYRTKSLTDDKNLRLGESFWDWGISTAISIFETKNAISESMNLIATGGIHSGQDIAKSIALGADVAATAGHILGSAQKSDKVLLDTLNLMMSELKYSMLLTGSKTINELKITNLVVSGKTAEWLNARGYNTSNLARRS